MEWCESDDSRRLMVRRRLDRQDLFAVEEVTNDGELAQPYHSPFLTLTHYRSLQITPYHPSSLWSIRHHRAFVKPNTRIAKPYGFLSTESLHSCGAVTVRIAYLLDVADPDRTSAVRNLHPGFECKSYPKYQNILTCVRWFICGKDDHRSHSSRIWFEVIPAW